jgi:hypothetical protein
VGKTRLSFAGAPFVAAAVLYFFYGVCEFRVPNTTPSGKVTATKHNWVPAQGDFVKPE